MMDLVGLDVALDIENHYCEEFPHLPKKSRDLLQSYVDAGKLGVKSGEGFYTYRRPERHSQLLRTKRQLPGSHYDPEHTRNCSNCPALRP